MRLLRNREARFQNLLPKVIGLGLSTLVLLGLLLTAMGVTRSLFADRTLLQLTLPDSRGIRSGTAVMLRGFRIGEVRDLALDDRGQVAAQLAVDSRHLRWLGPDSWVYRGRDNPLGDSYLAIEPGNGRTAAQADDHLRFKSGGEMEDLLTSVHAQLIPLLEQSTLLAQQMASPEGPLQTTLREAQRGVTRLEQSLDLLDRTLAETRALSSDARRTLHEDFAPLLVESRALTTQATSASQEAAALASELRSTLPPLRDQLDRNLQALEQLTPQLGEAAQQGGSLATSTQDALQDLRRSWPVQQLMPQSQAEPLLPEQSRD